MDGMHAAKISSKVRAFDMARIANPNYQMQSFEKLGGPGINPENVWGDELGADDSRRSSSDEDVVDATTEVNAFQALLHGQESEKGDRGLTALGPRRRRRVRWRKWLLIFGILVGGLLAIVSVGGVWVYKTAPPDGQSPPWYPTREFCHFSCDDVA